MKITSAIPVLDFWFPCSGYEAECIGFMVRQTFFPSYKVCGCYLICISLCHM